MASNLLPITHFAGCLTRLVNRRWNSRGARIFRLRTPSNPKKRETLRISFLLEQKQIAISQSEHTGKSAVEVNL